MGEEELRKYFDVYTDAWRIFRKYSNPDASDVFWERLKEDTEAVYNKHGKSHFSANILVATLNEIDRLYKERKTGNG